MTLDIAAELSTLFLDAGEPFTTAEGTTFQGVWGHETNDEQGTRGGQNTVTAPVSVTTYIANGDSLYRDADKTPTEYKVRDRRPDTVGVLETLVLETQD